MTEVGRSYTRRGAEFGLGAESDTTYFSPVTFDADGDPETDCFFLSPGTWEALGQPDRIIVSVTAA